MTRYVDGHSDVGSSSLLSYSTTLLEMSRKPVIMKQRHARRSGLERDTLYVAGLPIAAAAALTCIVERTLSDRS